MALNLVKLCVGAQSVADLAAWQASNRRSTTADGRACVFHTTFQRPKRIDDLLHGGSLYWVIKGTILVRQGLVGFADGHKEDGSPCCLILLDPKLIDVRPTPRRPFQGWRYLTADDAPPDLGAGRGAGISAMPPAMRKELAALCLL